MSENLNKINMGHYKNGEIQLKGENADKIVLVIKKFLGKTEIPLDRTTIRTFKHSTYEHSKHEIIIEWNDGKLSQAIIDETLYSVLYLKIKGKCL